MRTFLIAFLIPLAASASPLPDYPFVYVSGVATREVAPDKATLRFSIKTYAIEAQSAYTKQAEVADEILSFAAKLGIPSDAIVADPVEKSVVRREDDKGNELEIIGYNVRRTVVIRLSDLTPFPKLIEHLYQHEHVEDVHVTFGCKDDRAIMDALTTEASRVATQNAGRLAKGFGQILGRVRAISENGFGGLGEPFGMRGSLMYGATAGQDRKRDFRLVPKTISFSKEVYAIFSVDVPPPGTK